mgnify:CR=1 FL=1
MNISSEIQVGDFKLNWMGELDHSQFDGWSRAHANAMSTNFAQNESEDKLKQYLLEISKADVALSWRRTFYK